MESLPRVDSSGKVPGVIRPLPPKEYADALSQHAKRGIQASLYPGLNFAKLASFLQHSLISRKHTPRGPSPRAIEDQSFTFARQYTYISDGEKKVESFQHPDSFNDALSSPKQGEKTHSLLFLRGLPSPQWLSMIGGFFRVDPEFFQRHLDFWSTVGRINYFPLPSLPSTSTNMIQLWYITIGQRDSPGENCSPENIESMRRAGNKAMSRYTHILNTDMESGFALGTSIVRNFNVHDETYFMIEQRISIYLSRGGQARTTLVWGDTGKDLQQGPEGPWTHLAENSNFNHSVFYPTIQILPKVALKSHLMSVDSSISKSTIGPRPFAQSSAHLATDYGKSLDSKVMAIDQFYALHELFLFCAFSQSQYLNMLESKLETETASQRSSEKIEDQSQLLHHQSTLQVQVNRLRETIAAIEECSSLNQPRSMEYTTDKTQQQAARLLLNDYQHLLSRAERLSAQCQAQMALLMNQAMIAESNKAITQAQEVTKLTRLAFVFIPLSFTSSICGMNLHPFVSNANSIWVWFAISIPILLISFVLMRWDIVKLGEQVFKKRNE